MAGIVNSHNIMLKGNNSFPGVITDDTLTGNGLSTPLGVNDPFTLDYVSGDTATFTNTVSNSATVLKEDTDTGNSTYYDYHYINENTPFMHTVESWSHHSADPDQSGTYKKAELTRDKLQFTSGIYDSGYHNSANKYSRVTPENLTIVDGKTICTINSNQNSHYYSDSTDRVTARGYLGTGYMEVYSSNYFGNNCKTTISGGPVNDNGTTIEWSPSASGTFRNSGAGIYLQNWEPATINWHNQGLYIDCNGFEYHDHSLNKYYTGGDVYGSAAWYRNRWSIMSTGHNHQSLINARPANGYDETGDDYWLTMQYQGWNTSGSNTKTQMYSERSAQYSYSGTRYVNNDGTSANYAATGIHYKGSDISADITNSKVEYDTTVAGALTGTAIYKSNQITANNYRSNGLSSYFKIDLAPTQYNGNILAFSAKNSTATASYDNHGEYASIRLTTTGGTYNGSYRADGSYYAGPSTGYSATKGMNSISGVPIPSASTAHIDIQTDRGYIKVSNEGNHGVQISDYNVMSWLGYDQSRWVQLNPFALYFWDMSRKTGEPVAWISDRNMGFSMGTSAVNFSFEDLMKLKTIINAN
jgi:hypothetical protein